MESENKSEVEAPLPWGTVYKSKLWERDKGKNRVYIITEKKDPDDNFWNGLLLIKDDKAKTGYTFRFSGSSDISEVEEVVDHWSLEKVEQLVNDGKDFYGENMVPVILASLRKNYENCTKR